MTLRRTPLKRKTPLQARKPLRQRSTLKPGKSSIARTPAKSKRTAATGPSLAVKLVVISRSVGCCELCLTPLRAGDVWITAYSFHHRRPRAMGGTTRPETNGAANLLLLCGSGTTGCHGIVESDRQFAYEAGWLVRQHADPREVPVLLSIGPWSAELVTLDDDGGHWPVPA